MGVETEIERGEEEKEENRGRSGAKEKKRSRERGELGFGEESHRWSERRRERVTCRKGK